MPCSGLCGSCDGIFRKKCLSCQPNSSPAAGDTCSCDTGFYEAKKSYTVKECLLCSPFCGTCSGGLTTECGTCKYPDMEKKSDGSCGCPEGKYLSGNQCLECSPLCGTCSGGAATDCRACKYSYMEKKSDGSCGCPDGNHLSGAQCLACDDSCSTCSGPGSSSCLTCSKSSGRALSGTSCPKCHSTCLTCSGIGSDSCLSCSIPGQFFDSGTCKSCSSNDSPDCQDPITISIPTRLEEFQQNFTIVFKPGLNSTFPQNFIITAEKLVNDHFSLKFKRKDKGEQEPLTILDKQIIYKPDHSELVIKFLEKMRVSNSENIFMTVKDPWLYRDTTKPNSQNLAYLKSNEYPLKISEKEPTQEEKDLKSIAEAGRVARAAVGAIFSVGLVLSLMRWSGRSSIYLVKFFNILDIISNLAKINVQFGPRIVLVIEFIENLGFPEIPFLTRLSPLKDSSYDDRDVNAYLTMPRGTRGKMTESNREIFIASGQNFIICCTIIFIS